LLARRRAYAPLCLGIFLRRKKIRHLQHHINTGLSSSSENKGQHLPPQLRFSLLRFLQISARLQQPHVRSGNELFTLLERLLLLKLPFSLQ
jgi:hypothetical protein